MVLCHKGLQLYLFSGRWLCYIHDDNILRKEIAHLMLTGDFSARTCVKFDFVANDSCGHIASPPGYVTFLCQKSQDSHHNAHGCELADICQGAKLRILNGQRGEDQRKSLFTCMMP